MKHQILHINNRGKYCLYGLCLFLIFLLSLTYSSNVMGQYYNMDYSPNFLNFDWVYDLDMDSWNNNLNTLTAPMFTSNQGRSGFQAQAPQGTQVLSARSKHTLYSFWSGPSQDLWGQIYSPVPINPYQPRTYMVQTSSSDLLNPLIPPYDDDYYWHPTVSSPIGPPMFPGEPYWTGQMSALFGLPSSTGSFDSIGPSMFYGNTYWSPNLGGTLNW